MKPADFYKLPAIRINIGDDAVYAIESAFNMGLYGVPTNGIPGLEVRVHYDPYIDGNRVATWSSVWFKGVAVMVLLEGGRGGRDAGAEIITDRPHYVQLRAAMDALAADSDEFYVTPLDEDVVAVDCFYGGIALAVDTSGAGL